MQPPTAGEQGASPDEDGKFPHPQRDHAPTHAALPPRADEIGLAAPSLDLDPAAPMHAWHNEPLVTQTFRPQHIGLRRNGDRPAGDVVASVAKPMKLKRHDLRVGILQRSAMAAVEFAFQVLAQPEAKNASVVWSTVKDRALLNDFIDGSRRLLHEQALGKPASNLAALARVPESTADLLGDFVACYELPSDRVFLWTRRGSQALGVLAGLVGGHPVMVITSLRSLLRDEATRSARRILVKVVMQPARGLARPGNGPDIRELAELARAFGWIRMIPGER